MVNKKKIKVSNTELPFIDNLVRNLESTHAVIWANDGNVAHGTLKEGGKISINFPDEFVGDFLVIVDKKGELWYNKLLKFSNQEILAPDLAKTVFCKNRLTTIKNGPFLNLKDNKTILKELDKEFKSWGVKNVGYYDTFGKNPDNFVFDNLTVMFQPAIDTGNSDSYPVEFLNQFREMSGFKNIQTGGRYPLCVGTETFVGLMDGDTEIGRYYPLRNLVITLLNPFDSQHSLSTSFSYKDNIFLSQLLFTFSEAVKGANLKTINNEEFKLKLMVHNFNAASRKKASELKNEQTDVRSRVTNYEQELTTYYSKLVDIGNQIVAMTRIDDDDIGDFLKEIKKAESHKIVEKVETTDGKITMTFQPTTIKVPICRENSPSDWNKGPVYEIYVGRVTAAIEGNGRIIVTTDCPTIDDYPHPHTSQEQRPCLGTNDGASMIHKLLGERKFSDFVYVFWMWIRRFRPEDCYVKPFNFLDDRLKQGYPVFKPNGKRAKINDKALIKQGVFVEIPKTELRGDYAQNLKDFKDFETQP